jgi:protein-disulfide isomerase
MANPETNNNNTNTNTKIAVGFTAAIMLLVIAFIIVAIVQRQNSNTDAQIDPATGAPSLVRDDSHRLDDPPGATVTVVEFLDFECEACGAFYPIVEDVREKYDGQLTYVLRYFPLPGHKNSMNAALAVESAARQGQLEAMYNRMFQTQAEWGESAESQAPLFRTFAVDLGLDMAQYDADVADPLTQERVQSDFDDGRALGITSTPTFYVDGDLLTLESYGDLESAIAGAAAN